MQPEVRSPVRTLVVLASLFAVVAIGTWSYPPQYVALPLVHSMASAVTAAGLLWLAWFPSRRTVGWVGALAASTCALRSGLIWWTVLFNGTPRRREEMVSFVLAGTIWAVMAALIIDLWMWSVVPWVATRRTAGRDP